jgi:hypothetical protein
LDLSWLALVDEKWGERRHVLRDASQECNPGSTAVLRCTEQLPLLFEAKSENSLGFIYHAHKKAFFIHIISVARGNAVFLDFLADLWPSATKLRSCARTYQLKIGFVPRCIICSLPCNVKAIKPAATKVITMAFDEAI